MKPSQQRRNRWSRWFRKPPKRRVENNLFRPAPEKLEERTLLSVDILGTSFDATPEPLTAGQTFETTYEIRNDGTANSGGFAVEWYVSTTSTISIGDRRLDGVGFSGLNGGASTGQSSKSLTLPEAGDPFWNGDGTYYIGMIIDPDNAVTETDETNNANRGNGLDRDPVQMNDTLSGLVAGFPIAIQRHDAPSQPVNPNVRTWLIVHGNNSSPNTQYIDELARIVHDSSGGEQTLVLDWESIAAEPISATENLIIDVATWASEALVNFGFSGTDLNMSGT